MSIVSSTGMGSGIDIGALVKQLVAAEGQPAFSAITRQQTAANTRLSGLGTLKSALSDFQTAVAKLKDGNVFKTHQATSSDESILKVTAGSGAVAGSYALSVDKLAIAQKSIINTNFANADAPVGGGTLTFTTASDAPLFEVTIDPLHSTLADVKNAINDAEGNTSVFASIVTVGGPTPDTMVSKLVLTSKNTGMVNAFKVGSTDPGLSQISSTNLDPLSKAAQDAEISVDGLLAKRSSNSITDVLPGLTLDLKSQAPGTTVNVDVNLDEEAIKTAINDFVTAYNKLHSVAKDLGKYGGSTDGSGAGNGPLIGDATLRYVSSQLRQETTNTVSSITGDYNSLAMIGVKVDKDGLMSLDSEQLDTALSVNFQSVSEVFSSANGVATRLDSKLSIFLQSGGPLDSQQTSLKNQLSRLDDKRADVQVRLDNLQKTLQKQFIAMDVTVGKFNSTGNFLAGWLKKS